MPGASVTPDSLEGDAGGSVEEVDDSASGEAGLPDAMQHDDIIFVGVDPKVFRLLPAPFETGLCDAMGC